ncbi:MAG: response regulator transcription factor [Candidatus Dormiibacterota bacterium]
MGTSAVPEAARRALVIEDDPDIRGLLETLLGNTGFDVTAVAAGQSGLAQARRVEPELVILDLGLPDLDGIDVCRQLRQFSDAYLIIVSARGQESDRLLGLETGADDYLVKPFSPRELRARVAVLFRRPRSPNVGQQASGAGKVLEVDDLVVDPDARDVRSGGQPVRLTKIEFDLLATLAANPRRVWERDSLFRAVWETDWVGDTHALEVHVGNLRRKLGLRPDGDAWIQAIRGIGYRLLPG